MTKSAPAAKSQIANQAEEEPPSSRAEINKVAEEEPPSQTITLYQRQLSVPTGEEKNWRWQFRNRITTIEDLAKFVPLSAQEQAQLKLVTAKYPLSITPYYLSLINPHDANDPIRKQAVPSLPEIALATFGQEDPLEERRDSAVPGLVHRYPDRVLMVLTNVCPVYCRHCTRKREWRYGGWVRTPAQIEAMLDYIRQHKDIRDVILSGGDPLTLSTHRLEEIIAKLRRIEHVEIIRIGTRFPVVLPQRIDDELCAMLSKYGPIWVNTHFNHYREITPEAAIACDRLLRSGVPVNNQTVLLRGINDSLETQMKLCQGLLKIKVRPYYLFQCDEVQGTEHLRTPIEIGIKIMEGLVGYTSGLALPTFVVDLPQGGGKVPLHPNYIVAQNGDELIIRNYQGHLFRYRNPQALQYTGLPTEVSNPAHDLTNNALVTAGLSLQPEGAPDANRVVVRP